MTTLKESLSAADASVAALRPSSFSAELRSFESVAARAVAKVEQKFESLIVRPPEDANYNGLVRKAKKHGIAYSSGEDGFARRELYDLAWTLWIRVDGSCIAESPDLLAQYLQAFAVLKNRRHFRALAWSYLWNFAPDGPGFSVVAKALQKMLKIAPLKWEERHRRWNIWEERHRRWNIFAHSGAARMIARHFMSAGMDERAMEDAAKQIGFDGLLAHGGMSRAAFCTALHGYASAPNLESLRQLTAWRKFAAKSGGFCNSDYAEGLLLPWVGNAPSEDIKSETQSALLDSHDDPRVHTVNWASVDEQARDVMFRWLVGVSVEQFFHVIDKIGGEGTHMWDEGGRRKFWLAYYNGGHLSDAWAAFGGAGLHYLRGSDVAYATLNSAHYNHAVLLMRVGGLTIADWNHTGKCRIWKKGNKHAPQFYRRSYSANQLRYGSDEEFPHDHYGRWRGRVAGYIEEWTGIEMPFREYS